MKLVGLMAARNEQWIIGPSLSAALQFVDEIVVLDHASTDETPGIVGALSEAHPGRVQRIEWKGRHYNESAIRQALLEAGRARGGTHFFLIDADEMLTANLLESARSEINSLAPGEGLELMWLAMWGSPGCYRDDDSVWSNNTKLFAFADGPGVEHTALEDGYDIHLQAPRGLAKPYRRPMADQREGGVMHLQFANRRRLIAKHAWYKMAELVRFPGRQSVGEVDRVYSQALNEVGLRTTPVDPSWWSAYGDARASLRLDDEPWHEREVLRMWQEHGAGAFDGLELWGLPERLDRANRAPAGAGT